MQLRPPSALASFDEDPLRPLLSLLALRGSQPFDGSLLQRGAAAGQADRRSERRFVSLVSDVQMRSRLQAMCAARKLVFAIVVYTS